jgi:uncharacterized protein (DUF302 family)
MKKLLSKWLMGNIVEKYKTNAPYDKIIETITEVVKDNNFAVVTIHDMKETYKKKSLKMPDDFEYKIIQICNAPKSHKALTKLSFDMGVMMPKSIIIARENSKTSLRFMKMKPWMVSMMFPELDIVPMSKIVTETITKIVKETIEKAEKLGS